MSTVRTIWTAAEGAEAGEGAELKKDIAQTVNHLKARIESRLSNPMAAAAKEPLLFDAAGAQKPPGTQSAAPSSLPRFPEPTLRVYAKDFAEHAIEHLPRAVNYHSVEEFREYLVDRLRFNSLATRQRFASYITNRYFPGDNYNSDLPQFAAVTAGTPALGEGLFYLTCRTEKIVSLAAEDLIFPSLVHGGVSRSRLHEYIQSKFPLSKSADEIGQAIVRTYQFFGIGSPNRTELRVTLREGSLAAFAYVLHHEFPEPGMHAFEQMLHGPMHKWVLWDQQWMVRQLYRLREVGLLTKVSEIDRLRHFTTKYTMADAAQRIVALAKESRQ